MALVHKGQHVQEIYIDVSHKPKEFLDLTPTGTTPVMRHGDVVLTESDDIVDYAEKIFDGPSIASSEDAKQVGKSVFKVMKEYFLNQAS